MQYLQTPTIVLLKWELWNLSVSLSVKTLIDLQNENWDQKGLLCVFQCNFYLKQFIKINKTKDLKQE